MAEGTVAGIVACDAFVACDNKKEKCVSIGRQPVECRAIKQKYRENVPVSNGRVAGMGGFTPFGACRTA
jgi:hypothetical protein